MAKKPVVKATKAVKPTKKESKALTITDLQSAAYNKMLDGVEKDVGISSEEIHKQRLSTGTLSIDLIIGGGMRAGMFTLVGKETGGKSTQLMGIFGHAARMKIPVLEYQDVENSVDPQLTTSIMRIKNMTEVFGKRQEGNWVVQPKIRYYDDNIMETTFDRIVQTLNRIPDKIYRPDLDQWFLVVDQSNKKLAGFNTKTLGNYNTKLSDKGKLWFPTDNPYPQAIFGIDSYPLLLPEGIDEKEESNKGMAQQARAFSAQLIRVVGKLRRKNVILLGTNQIREKPGVMFGPTEYEPSGNALKQNSQVRNWYTPRAVPDEWKHLPKESKYSEEPSVEGRGVDQYAYKHVGNKKCKWGTPFLETWIRIWISDHNGQGRGICPVFDTYTFLSEVGLVTRSKKQGQNQISFIKGDHPFSGLSLEWLEFKTLILAEEFKTNDLKEKAEKVYKKYKINKPYSIVKSCHQLLSTGAASSAATNNRIKAKELKALKAKSVDDDLEG